MPRTQMPRNSDAFCIPSDNINVDTNGNFRLISIDQSDVIESFLQHNDVKPTFNILSPMSDKYTVLSDNNILNGEEINKFQSIIGSLNYFSGMTRYDIAYPVSRLSQLANKPTRGARKGLDRVLSYLLSTRDFKISGIFSPKRDIFEFYSDSDHAGDMPITSHSHTGTILKMNDVPIFWRSK